MYDRPEPIQRKVQLTGGSTYTVSLPKDWATMNDIENGTSVDCYAQDTQLVIHPPSKNDPERRVILDAANRSSAEIARSIVAGYIAGLTTIEIRNVTDRTARRTIRDVVVGLVGLEVQIEDENRIVARTMLDARTLSPVQTLSQMRMTTLTMHEEAIEAVLTADEDRAAAVVSRDDEVDRLFGVLAREFHRSVLDAGAPIERDGLTAFDFYNAARQLERIGDHAEKVATQASRLPNPPRETVSTQVRGLGDEARTVVDRALEGFIATDADTSFLAVPRAMTQFRDRAESLDRQLYEAESPEMAYALGTILDSIVRTAEYGQNIAEGGLTASMRRTEKPDIAMMKP